MEEKLINEEKVLEGAEKVLEATKSNKNLAKYGAYGAGAVALCAGAYFGYKKLVKPGVAKIKAKFAEKKEAKNKAISNINYEEE